ncbi:hypothetical protein C1645_827474 [Glomus cerebriforme]|uniref:Uncharacterized protein n=1 Tax=Glomus cerebriforme TaxID=658196 RepID=A0A397SUU5_9GLOM|nr:hypothetical protein C1645_827474 [Glomus cerebriforme]
MFDNYYIELHFIVVVDVISFSPLFTLMFGSKIIKEESRGCIFLIYVALIWQFVFIILVCMENSSPYPITTIAILSLLCSLFINTILCHRNFGKNLKLYLELNQFNPNLDKEYEYSNLSDDDDDDEEEEKKEKFSEKLKRYWKIINNNAKLWSLT